METVMTKLEIIQLSKAYDGKVIFNDFSITFPISQITCILGPSGCGKTTLLNIIGGITAPDTGTLKGWEDKTISYIFQDPRLLPWKTVEENIDFVLSRDIPLPERKKITGRFIRLVELEGFSGYYPSKLSGGMRQRVSIARAFAYPSDIILMDEPLKGLDIKLKMSLVRTFSRIWQNDRRTVLFVTHDVDEALMLGNYIMVLTPSPVKVAASETVTEPLDKRTPGIEGLVATKNRLLKALGSE
ncbi:MAG: ABC transporter ATP-binding protein [Bacteroidales bacterium]|nr:ABC transporter ATP-binding protein [Bacteroidales bacterium]